MKKIILAALMLPLSALAQTYPSPTFNTLTLQTPLSAANGGTGATSATGTGSIVLNTSPTIANPAITGSLTATGLVTTADMASQAANTVLANVTSSSASPTAFAMPGCSSATSALQWTSGTGFTCYGNSASLTGATFTGFSSIAYSNPTFAINDTSATNKAVTTFQKNGVPVWNVGNSSTAGTFAIDRFVSGSYVDSPVTVANATGAVSMIDGLNVTGTTGLGTPTSIGTSVYPTIVAPVSTTATTTNGSANITVTNATGLVQYQGIYGAFVTNCNTTAQAETQPYIASISGTTVTMSCPATATNSTPVAVQFGQVRYSATSSILANDIGTQSLKVGSVAQSNSVLWMNQITSGADYRATNAAMITPVLGGGYALTVGARTSDTTGGALAFPFQAYFLADTWGAAGRGGEAAYLQSNLSSATAGYAPHFQMEQTIISSWPFTAEDPYTINANNQTIVHRLDCGNGAATVLSGVNNCSAAIDIVPNPNSFGNGIVIANGAIPTNGNALAMPLSNGVTWFSASNTYSGFITSPSAANLLFGVNTGGSFSFSVAGSQVVAIGASEITPATTNTLALGDSSHVFSNIYGNTINAGTLNGTSVFAGTLSTTGNDALTYQTTASQSIPSGTQTTLTTWTKVFDRVNANFNATTGVFTAPATAIYQVQGTIGFGGSTSTIGNQFALSVLANSAQICANETYSQSATTTGHAVSISCLVSLTSGQTVALQAFQNTGSAVTLNTTASNNFISINRVP